EGALGAADAQRLAPARDRALPHAPMMHDGLGTLQTERPGQPLVDDRHQPFPPLAQRPGDGRVGQRDDDHLAANLAAHLLTDAVAWRAILAQQAEAVGVGHGRMLIRDVSCIVLRRDWRRHFSFFASSPDRGCPPSILWRASSAASRTTPEGSLSR